MVVAEAVQRGEKRLVAYIVPVTSSKLDAVELKDYLTRRLPSYMIPSAFVPIESLPLSPNGKVDRSALLRAQPLEFGDADSVVSPAPFSDLEQVIPAICQTTPSPHATLLWNGFAKSAEENVDRRDKQQSLRQDLSFRLSMHEGDRAIL